MVDIAVVLTIFKERRLFFENLKKFWHSRAQSRGGTLWRRAGIVLWLMPEQGTTPQSVRLNTHIPVEGAVSLRLTVADTIWIQPAWAGSIHE